MLNLPMSAVSHFFLWVHLRSRILPMTQVWKGTKTASLPRCKWWFSDFFSNLAITGKACRGGTSTRGTKLDEKHPEGLWLFQILWSCIKGGKKRLQIQFHFLQTSFNFIFFEDVLWFNNIIMTPSLTKTSSPEALFFKNPKDPDPSLRPFPILRTKTPFCGLSGLITLPFGGSNDPP